MAGSPYQETRHDADVDGNRPSLDDELAKELRFNVNGMATYSGLAATQSDFKPHFQPQYVRLAMLTVFAATFGGMVSSRLISEPDLQVVLSFFSSLTFYQWVAVVSAATVACYAYRWCWRPLWYVQRTQPDPVKRKSKHFLPPFPNGWFKVGDSRELKAGDVKPVKMLGQELVMFRTRKGKQVVVMDAYCPHLGANLAVGGRVVGDCIECPFHGWQFNKDGKCTHIPYVESTKHIPDLCKTRAWRVREVNGVILLWHHVDGDEPSWEPLVFPTHERMRWHGKSEHWVTCHIAELPENGTDFAHFGVLHAPFVFSIPGFEHKWEATWEQNKEHPHLAEMIVGTRVRLFGWLVPGVYTKAEITQMGPAIVHLVFNTVLGRIIVTQSVAPVAPLLQRAQHVVFADWWIPRFVAKFFLVALVSQFERDVPIWSNKQWLHKPLLLKEDGPIAKFRRYFKQFYSDSGSRRRQALDW